MKTYKQQKKENKAKLHWLRQLKDDQLNDCIGILKGVPDWTEGMPYLNVFVKDMRITRQMESYDIERDLGGNLRPIMGGFTTEVDISGLLINE